MHRWLILTVAAIPLMFNAFRPAPPSFVWWTSGALEKIRPYDSPPVKLKQTVHISAARNEFEAFQIVFRAGLQDLDGMDLDISDLKGPNDAVLSNKNVTIYFERDLNFARPSSIEGKAGEWPDALIPRTDRYFGEKRNAFPFKLAKQRNQPIWIEVYVPPSVKPGTYHGAVTVSIDGKRDETIPVTLEVWKFALPSTSSFATSFGLNGLTALRQHAGKYTNDDDVIRFTNMYRKAALWHRLSVHNGSMVPPRVQFAGGKIKVDWTAYDKEIGPFLDGTAIGPDEPLSGAKVTSVDAGSIKAMETDRQKVLYWRAFADHFREKGWIDRLFNYLWDEPKPEDYGELVRLGTLAHSADGAIKNLVAASFRPDWARAVDVFAPLINCFEFKPGNQNDCDQHMAQPKMPNIWWYQSCASHGCNTVGGEYYRGWPSYIIDIDGVANRIMPWLAWKYDVKGELYYAMNEAYSRKEEDPWDNVSIHGGNGEGTLFYPGRPPAIGGKTDIPIESIRLKLIRDGLEDYEYLVLLSKHEGHDAASRFVDRLVTNVYTYNRDPDTLDEVRREMGEELTKRL